jgi:hypothetical protein
MATNRARSDTRPGVSGADDLHIRLEGEDVVAHEIIAALILV